MSSVSNSEIAKRIREGNQKRREEERKKQQLEQEYLEVVTKKLNEERQSRSPTRFLPSILICLLFVSFPLSEQVVDWYLVGIFCVLNTLLAFAFTNPSEWLSIASTVLINFLLVRFSSEIYNIPQRLVQVPLILLVNYVAINLLIVAAAYFLYVSPRFLRFSRSYGGKRGRQTSAKHRGHHSNEYDVLEAFAMQKEEAERLDLLLCLLLLLNVAALIYFGVIPFHLVLQNGLNVFRLLK
ncbi:hypothetical protein conserved [Leishmania donovani]|uniref:Uncharacterized protein n=3 Tax=Leishmania donovani species complex TaxID=38574 RepID=A4HT17_LEIIN|nr:conserved hypothetical protein [Leishmania infantum JPCM5]XP_003858436.1 hypothetical protein, conserved [Leishmania donovani]CAC9447273.1 hypothetical_protein_-_conserved [Leishmania infantum]AYU76162.1 hypothetical protein LdCL_060018300 [Leishmania donovani]TPP49709.1 hypothetical protein CGC20_19755 [Leishmania donovani]TPP54785.1 hypothetical protein CGC21_23960 [Leishmania donovani]CAJ1986228.1 hypothetical protein conserved [Leishmania donovani]|eukprot:XP_001463208.1 conserved hypothetical protein [Leishmania infantum JPCM5]